MSALFSKNYVNISPVKLPIMWCICMGAANRRTELDVIAATAGKNDNIIYLWAAFYCDSCMAISQLQAAKP